MNKLKDIRKERGWTQSYLAEQLHVSQKTISAWERYFRIPPAAKMQQIEDLSQVPKEQIFSSAFDYKGNLKVSENNY